LAHHGFIGFSFATLAKRIKRRHETTNLLCFMFNVTHCKAKANGPLLTDQTKWMSIFLVSLSPLHFCPRRKSLPRYVFDRTHHQQIIAHFLSIPRSCRESLALCNTQSGSSYHLKLLRQDTAISPPRNE
jgi:hypothetical protein